MQAFRNLVACMNRFYVSKKYLFKERGILKKKK